MANDALAARSHSVTKEEKKTKKKFLAISFTKHDVRRRCSSDILRVERGKGQPPNCTVCTLSGGVKHCRAAAERLQSGCRAAAERLKSREIEVFEC